MRKNDIYNDIPEQFSRAIFVVMKFNPYLSCCVALCLLSGFVLNAQHKGTLTSTLSEWSNDPDLSCASIAFYAIDLKSGSVVENFNGDKAMIPASLMKLSTTVAALELLGPDFTFSTEFYHDGFIDAEGVLHGNLHLAGSGDPSFGSVRLGERPDRLIARFAESMRRVGINAVTGNVFVDNASFTPVAPGSWSWEDLTNYYAAIPHPVNFLENKFSMVFKTGPSATKAELVSVSPDMYDIQIDHKVQAEKISGDETFCYGHPFGNRIEVRGQLPENRQAFSVKGAIPNPGELFVSKVMEAAANLGVKWEGKVLMAPVSVESKVLMIRHNSPTLLEIVNETNAHSVNLFAEGMVVAMGKEGGHEKGLEVIHSFWSDRLENGVRGLILKDGSGLSHYNTITIRQLVEILQYAHSQPYRSQFETSLPVAGQSGTLRSFGKGTALDGKMRAKSGYMTGNRGYAGFMTLASGRKVAFALMANHYDISAASMRLKMEDLLQKIANTE